MSKGLLFCMVMFVSAFFGLNWALTRPTGAPIANAESNIEPNEVLLQTAEFVKKNPEGFKPQLAGIKLESADKKEAVAIVAVKPSMPVEVKRSNREVLGFSLDASSQQELCTDAGFEKFKSKVGENTTVAVQDLTQAWASTDLTDTGSRTALLEITNSLAKVTEDPSTHEMLLNEAEAYLPATDHQDMEHGGRALQYYLTQEKDPDKMKANLEKLGIPMIVIEAGRAPAANATPPK